MLGSNT